MWLFSVVRGVDHARTMAGAAKKTPFAKALLDKEIVMKGTRRIDAHDAQALPLSHHQVCEDDNTQARPVHVATARFPFLSPGPRHAWSSL